MKTGAFYLTNIKGYPYLEIERIKNVLTSSKDDVQKRGIGTKKNYIRLKYATKHYTKSNGENIPQTNYGINYLQNIVMEFSKKPKIII